MGFSGTSEIAFILAVFIVYNNDDAPGTYFSNGFFDGIELIGSDMKWVVVG